MHKKYKNKEKRKRYMKEYRNIHKEEIKIYNREYMREYYWRNRKENVNNDNNHSMGRKYELEALKLLPNSIDLNKEMRGKFDIYWNGLNIEVKSREKKIKGNGRLIWNFRKNEKSKADYYLFFCLDNKKIKKVLFIPEKDMKFSIGVGIKSKWDKYFLQMFFKNH